MMKKGKVDIDTKAKNAVRKILSDSVADRAKKILAEYDALGKEKMRISDKMEKTVDAFVQLCAPQTIAVARDRKRKARAAKKQQAKKPKTGTTGATVDAPVETSAV